MPQATRLASSQLLRQHRVDIYVMGTTTDAAESTSCHCDLLLQSFNNIKSIQGKTDLNYIYNKILSKIFSNKIYLYILYIYIHFTKIKTKYYIIYGSLSNWFGKKFWMHHVNKLCIQSIEPVFTWTSYQLNRLSNEPVIKSDLEFQCSWSLHKF